MEVNKKIKRILFLTLWVVLAAGITVVSIAAIRSKREKVCKGYEIEIKTTGALKGFMEKGLIAEILTDKGKESIKGKSTSKFDLQKMEARIEAHRWVNDAELFFDNNQVLKVNIHERIPVARVLSVGGNSFYIDSSCQRLPLSDKLSARVPVFTGFPGDKTRLKAADRLLLREIRILGEYILSDPFWMAQISQVDITKDRNFEMVPTIGNHIIEFGDGSNHQQKFDRLYLFYKQILSKTGMEKYARINVQYARQIIGVKNSYLTKYDSLRFVKSIEYMIASSRQSDSVRHDSMQATTVRPAKGELTLF